MRAPWVLAAAAVWLCEAMALGQDQPLASPPAGLPPAAVAPVESAARVQLDRADSLLVNGSAEEAWEVYRRVMDTHGDRLVEWPVSENTAPMGFRRYAPVRELAWMKLAQLQSKSPDAFAVFRQQLDPQARRWFDQAGSREDSRLDQRIVDELFLSSFGDDALLRLGDSALERGDYNSARRYWERIAPGLRFASNQHKYLSGASNRPLWLPFIGVDVRRAWPTVAPLFADPSVSAGPVYPDTRLSVAEVRARLAIASILEGNFDRATIEIDLLRQVAPDAEGTIAGRAGKFTDRLAEFLAEARDWPSAPREDAWLTFTGSTNRNPRLPAIAQIADRPLWSVSLPKWSVEHEAMSLNRVRVAEDAQGILPYHPLVVGNMVVGNTAVGDTVIVQTGPSREQVQALRLRTGEHVFPAAEQAPISPGEFDRRTVFGVPRFTLSAAGTTLFRIDGFSFVSAAADRRRFSARLEALDLASERKLLWDFSPQAPEWPEPFALAGPPLAAGPRLFVTLRRREAAREETHVAALDARDGRLLWKQLVCAAEPAVEPGWSELTHQLLTVDQDTVYCNSNSGLVAALDARTGRVRWITGYPRVGLEDPDPDRNRLHLYRDLNPCLVCRDVVVVAPTDCNRLFALDATNGVPLWVTPAELAADAIHLLGVSQEKLAVSGECVYWFELRSGRLLGQYPQPFKPAAGFARPSPSGYGRGILAGDYLYWPTREAILVFDQRTPGQETGGHPEIAREIRLADREATGGNLALGKGTLLIAGADRLWAFDAQPSR